MVPPGKNDQHANFYFTEEVTTVTRREKLQENDKCNIV